MTPQDPHWSDLPAEPQRAPAPEPVTPQPRPALGALAQRLIEVSPAWAQATVAPDAAPSEDLLAPTLGRNRAHGVESIREGWLLHRDASRVAAGADPDLALLMGDWCYAAGLCAIADHGSLDDVATLAGLVADVSARAGESIETLDATWQETTGAMKHA